MITAIAILLGSAAGGAARYWLSGLIAQRIGETFPWGTLVVNVTGAGLIGVLAGSLGAHPAPPWSLPWAVLAIGFLGSYTTVSSFSLQTLRLVQDRQWQAAAGNVTLSLLLCLAAAAVGLLSGARWLGR